MRKFSRLETAQVPVPMWYVPMPIYTGGRQRAPGLGGAVGSGGAAPSLDSLSGGLGAGLQSMSDGLTSMLNSAGSTLSSAPHSSGGGGGGGGFV